MTDLFDPNSPLSPTDDVSIVDDSGRNELSDVFSGKLTITEALEKLRKRLLDTTSRNRLINFRPTPGRSLKIYNAVPDSVFRQVKTPSGCELVAVPDPPRVEWSKVRDEAGQIVNSVKPPAEDYARKRGIRTEEEAPKPSSQSVATGAEGRRLQTLYYPEDLHKHCRRLASLARAAVDEKGVNTLHLVFGFLSFKERDDSRTLLAPLLALEVKMQEVGTDRATGLKRHSISSVGADAVENEALREKLQIEFGITLPEFAEEDQPEAYLAKVARIIQRKEDWAVRRRVVVSDLSFAKMMLLNDLKPGNWPKDLTGNVLSEHGILKRLIGGGTRGEFRETLRPVDNAAVDAIPLISDADTSQHAAILDVLDGADLVIDGPPGTGKSQTITNVIAAAIAAGKKVLFVAEKAAALEVVKRRLDAASLGDFCLELHGLKTSSADTIQALKLRHERRYAAPQKISHQIDLLQEKRSELIEYVTTLNSPLPGPLGMTGFEVLWATERARVEAHPFDGEIAGCEFQRATSSTLADFDRAATVFHHVVERGDVCRRSGISNAWNGLFLTEFSIGIERTIREALNEFLGDAAAWRQAIEDLNTIASTDLDARDISHCRQTLAALAALPEQPSPFDPELVAKLNEFEEAGALATRLARRLAEAKRQYQAKADARGGLQLVANSIDADTARSLKRVNEALEAAGLQAVDVVGIEAIRRGLNAVAADLEQRLTRLKAIAEELGLEAPETDDDIRKLVAILAILDTATDDLVSLRRRELAEPRALPILREAISRAKVLRDQRKLFSEQYHSPETLNLAPLQRAIADLKEGSSLWRRLLPGPRRAKEFYRRLSRNGKFDWLDAPRQLTNLHDYLAERSEFESDNSLRILLGPLFQGVGTDFQAIERMCQWYRAAGEAASAHSVRFDVDALDDKALRHALSQVKPWLAELSEFSEATSRLGELLRGVRAPPALQDKALIWRRRLLELSVLVRGIPSVPALWRETMYAQGPLAKLIEAVEAVLASRMIEAEIADDAVGQRLFGRAWRGLDTNTAAFETHLTWLSALQDRRLPAATVAALNGEHGVEIARWLRTRLPGFPADQFVDRLRSRLSQSGVRVDLESLFGLPSNDMRFLERLEAKVGRCVQAMDGLHEWVQYNIELEQALELELSELVRLAEAQAITPEKAKAAFAFVFYGTLAHKLIRESRGLRRFAGNKHESVRSAFANLDREIIAQRGQLVAAEAARTAAPPAGQTGARVAERTEMVLLQHLFSGGRPPKLRSLFLRAGRAIQALKPCFMMSPSSVAQYLKPGSVKFDLVLMDEASQIKPEEAIGAIARGAQLVVVGDPKQLPPTRFFDRLDLADDVEDDDIAVESSESILDACAEFFPQRRLLWHYRSRHQSLIAFSNAEFYDRKLIVFPSSQPRSPRLGLNFRYIANGAYEGRRNIPEAEAVVAEVVRHMRQNAGQSLAVVAVNAPQQELIEELVDRLRSNDPAIEGYLLHWRDTQTPFIVKNLENVQGDERDVVFVSLTYGPDPHSRKVRQNFGPIARKLGGRRLNVLFTRARISLHVFSSMRASDILEQATTPAGTRVLKRYLEYAAEGILGAGTPTEREPDSDFEVAVASALGSRGYGIVPQFGVAGYFIDLVVRNPDRPGEYLCAIECDGATYHSAASARDRDRLRQEIIENLGWKGRIWRIWSTDWFARPRRELDKLIAFIEQLRASARTSAEMASEIRAQSIEQQPLRQPLGPAEAVGRRLVAKPSSSGAVQPIAEAPASGITRMAGEIARDLDDADVTVDEELYVEVGDTVVFIYEARPDETKIVRIVPDGQRANFEQGIIPETTPLAQVLLDTAEGGQTVLAVPGQKPMQIRIKKIRRARRIPMT